METLRIEWSRIPRLLRSAPELIVLGTFSAVWIIGVLVLRLPVNVPDVWGWHFALHHYVGPVALAGICHVGVAMAAVRLRRGQSNCNPFLIVRLLPVMAGIVFLHFNFKAWMPLVNHHSWDAAFMATDRALQPVVDAFRWVRGAAASLSPVALDGAYHGMFVAAFFVSSTAHALFDDTAGTRRMILAMGLVLLFGGISYWIMPAVGPFIYEPGMNTKTSEAQAAMWKMYQSVVRTGYFPPGYFVVPLVSCPG